MKINRLNAYAALIILVAFIKLWFVSNNEIVTMPYDAEAYATRALYRLWQIGSMHSGYPIWLSATHLIGLPQRISIEILYLLSCFFVVNTIKEYVGCVAATILYIVLAFAPFTYFLFDQALSDGFYLCLTLIALGFSFRLLNGRALSIYFAAGLGLTLGLMLITRAEDQIIYFWIFLVTVFFAMFCNGGEFKVFSVGFWRKPIYLFLVTSGTTIIIVSTVCAIFYGKNGVFARTITLLPSHYKLLTNLAMIDSGIPQSRYIPISSASRNLAYAASPTLNTLSDVVEDTSNTHQSASRKAGLPNGEIGAGWIWWTFLDAMYKTLPDKSPVSIDNYFKKINSELDLAFADDRLKKRFIINPLIGGNLPQLLSNLPSGVLTVFGKSFNSYSFVGDQIVNNSVVFDKACLRRSALTGHPSHIILQGWAFASPSPKKILTIMARTTSGNYEVATYNDRPDVSNGFEKSNGWKPMVYGFRVEVGANSLEDVTLTYIIEDGTMVISSLFPKGQVSTIDSGKISSNSKIVQGIDLAEAGSTRRSGFKHEMQMKLMNFTSSRLFVFLTMGISIAFFFLTIAKVNFKKSVIGKQLLIFQFLLLTLFGARIMFYSLIETASWDVEIRYLASTQAIFVIFCMISLVTIVNASRKVFP